LISRRGFAAAITAAAAFPAWADDSGLAARCVGAIRAAMAVLPSGPVLLNSFVVDDGPGRADFDLTQADAAYVYDNALAGLALLAAGDRDDAARIGRALAMAQAHDRFWKDGRLRNAYQAGAMTAPAKLPGWWDKGANLWREDPYQVGSQSGPVAWAMLLWAALGMTAPANLAGDWLDDQLRSPRGYYGGFYGFEPKPLKLMWQSTEQNTDLYAAFGKLGRAEDARHAGGFVHAMFDVGTRKFGAGLTPAGASNKLLAVDAGTWPYLAGLGNVDSALQAITALRRGAGVGFSAASRGIWPEGTAFAALTLEKQGDGLAEVFLQTVAGQISPAGYVYASVAPVLSTGFDVGPAPPGAQAQKFNYYRRPALAPTAWAVLAGLRVNPLGG
jgi:hypothetical protein